MVQVVAEYIVALQEVTFVEHHMMILQQEQALEQAASSPLQISLHV